MKARRFERALLVFFALAFLGLGALRTCFTGNLTVSEPTGLYVRVPGTWKRGGMVELRPLIKHLAGVPGDEVRVTPEGSYINGKLWPYSGIPTDTLGYRPFPFGTYRLHDDQYWVLGLSPNSLDSRFLGMISTDMISSAIRPLWTVSNGYAPGTRWWAVPTKTKGTADESFNQPGPAGLP